MKRVLLMGNPNVGKSVVFSRLTGVNVVSSNYPGTTVGYTRGHMHIGSERVEIVDVPGAYTLDPTCKAEEVAVEMLLEGDLVMNIVDATNLERNLFLTLQLLEKDIPLLLALNIWDEARHRGIHIDVEKLEAILGVPIVPTVAVSGEGIKELVSRLPEARVARRPSATSDELWSEIGRITAEVQTITHRHHTWRDRFEEASIKPITGIPIALTMILLVFTFVRLVGEGLIAYLFEPLFHDVYAPLLMKIGSLLGSGGIVHDVVVGTLIDGRIDFELSFGVLSTGLFVPLGIVLPYVFAFYFALGFLEDLGYLPRLAVLTDNFMHRLGLHGYAIIPNVLGLGCNVPGILATRILESKRERFIAATIMAIGVPCAALQAMILGLVGERGVRYVAVVYGTLFLVWFLLGFILNRVLKGFSPEILTEIPPYRFPPFRILLRKLWYRLSNFLREAIPFVLLGVLLINVLFVFKIMNAIATLTAPVIRGIFGLPEEAISVLVIGFLRKDIAVGMLGPLNLSTKQLVVGTTVLSIYFPCAATFIILLKELGLRGMLRSAGIMILVAITVGGLLNLIL
ncbi:MAG: ferrous iron transporter B [Gemmatimonadota bacterium]|nr:MAG: ferrous iron transporter B [Gemmatimonadota bacterium]